MAASAALRAQVAAKWQESFNRLNRTEPGISGLTNYSHAWNLAREALRPMDISDPKAKPPGFSLEQVRHACEVLNKCRRLPILLEVFTADVKESFVWINREIDAYMAQYQETNDPVVVSQLVLRLRQWYLAWKPKYPLGSHLTASYTLNFQTHLFAHLPPEFAAGFKALCDLTLIPSESILPAQHAFLPSTSSPLATAMSTDMSSPSQLQTQIHTPTLFSAFDTLGLIDRYDSLLASVGYTFISAHISSTCARQWTKPVLPELRKWMTDVIVPWLVVGYAPGCKSAEEARGMLQGVGSRFDFWVNKCVCDLRTEEIFDIIIDYPESAGALEDLKECLQRVDQRAALVSALRKAQRKRLLHPAAETKVILSQYVATIRCLRIVDPPGVLLYKVADPIRRYLRDRPDTIRAIVANLVGDDDDGGEALLDDSEPVQPLQTAEVEDYTEPNWEPEPIDAGRDFRLNKPSDIISTLVSIYDSKDLFVKELQVMLAQRLLGVRDEEGVERERRNIEILKIRFGEAALQVCEVMLRDMTDSKRIDQHVQTQKPSIVHPTIISKQFWPSLDSSTDIVMPGQFQTLQEAYAKEFMTFKPDKRLKWLPHLGTVDLELELADRVVVATVPALEAAFIELFSESARWTVDDLRARVGAVERPAALKALLTWVDLGVLKEENEGEFILLETAEEGGHARSRPTAPVMAMEEPPIVSSQEQEMAQIQVYWKFIEGMLTNLGPMSLDRVHGMLKLAPDYDRTMDQLAGLLEAARREGMLVVRDGLWRLNK
ncbi:ubiquitin-protein ligase [Pterulicium gracile]|uniref:Anaphase-promoting complex subunit 2 n=1 Tax=Pterulicium gracile TaxID=1884261 RepID=A0A5C3Q426_9AGAR|nr:ubiquitin-protein ligase [Pterula gracilis]